MERKLLARMLGAGALVAALVIVGPLLLDGRSDLPAHLDDAGSPVSTDEFQTHTVTLRPRAAAAPPAGVENVPPRPASQAVPALLPATATPGAPSSAPVQQSPAPQANVRVASQPAVVAPPVVKSAAPVAEAPQAASPPGAAVGGWAVQLGTFGERANAERLTRELAGRGFAAFVSPFNQSGKSLYRVRVGPVREKSAAEDLARRLAEGGHVGPVVTN